MSYHVYYLLCEAFKLLLCVVSLLTLSKELCNLDFERCYINKILLNDAWMSINYILTNYVSIKIAIFLGEDV